MGLKDVLKKKMSQVQLSIDESPRGKRGIFGSLYSTQQQKVTSAFIADSHPSLPVHFDPRSPSDLCDTSDLGPVEDLSSMHLGCCDTFGPQREDVDNGGVRDSDHQGTRITKSKGHCQAPSYCTSSSHDQRPILPLLFPSNQRVISSRHSRETSLGQIMTKGPAHSCMMTYDENRYPRKADDMREVLETAGVAAQEGTAAFRDIHGLRCTFLPRYKIGVRPPSYNQENAAELGYGILNDKVDDQLALVLQNSSSMNSNWPIPRLHTPDHELCGLGEISLNGIETSSVGHIHPTMDLVSPCKDDFSPEVDLIPYFVDESGLPSAMWGISGQGVKSIPTNSLLSSEAKFVLRFDDNEFLHSPLAIRRSCRWKSKDCSFEDLHMIRSFTGYPELSLPLIRLGKLASSVSEAFFLYSRLQTSWFSRCNLSEIFAVEEEASNFSVKDAHTIHRSLGFDSLDEDYDLILCLLAFSKLFPPTTTPTTNTDEFPPLFSFALFLQSRLNSGWFSRWTLRTPESEEENSSGQDSSHSASRNCSHGQKEDLKQLLSLYRLKTSRSRWNPSVDTPSTAGSSCGDEEIFCNGGENTTNRGDYLEAPYLHPRRSGLWFPQRAHGGKWGRFACREDSSSSQGITFSSHEDDRNNTDAIASDEDEHHSHLQAPLSIEEDETAHLIPKKIKQVRFNLDLATTAPKDTKSVLGNQMMIAQIPYATVSSGIDIARFSSTFQIDDSSLSDLVTRCGGLIESVLATQFLNSSILSRVNGRVQIEMRVSAAIRMLRDDDKVLNASGDSKEVRLSPFE